MLLLSGSRVYVLVSGSAAVLLLSESKVVLILRGSTPAFAFERVCGGFVFG